MDVLLQLNIFKFCRGLVKISAAISSVGQYLNLMSPFSLTRVRNGI